MPSISGEIYVEVEAKTVTYGASLLDVDVSGNDSGGEGGQSGTYWILWDYHIENNQYMSGGYRNTGWYWGETDNYLSKGWSAFLSEGGASPADYTDDYNGFIKYLTDVQPQKLDGILGDWPSDGSKGRFVNVLYKNGAYSCIEHF